MTTAPWLTIITVVKDDADGLVRTLATLAPQDLTGVEYLIVDSSSDPAAVPDTLARSGLAGDVQWTAPAGIYAAMNEGLARACGTYVYFLNAGDELAGPSVLAALREAIDAAQPDWLYADVEIVHTDGSTTVTPRWDYAHEQARAFSGGHFPPHQGTVVRTSTLRQVGGFDPTFRIVADYAAFLSLSKSSTPTRMDLVIARFHEGGASTIRWAASVREFHRARQQVLAPTGSVARHERTATLRQFVLMSAHRSPWPLSVALILLVLAVMGITGVAWPTSAALVGMVAAQALGGALWWRLLRPRRSVPIVEAVGAGLALGTAASMLTGLVLGWWLAPLLAVGGWLVLARRTRPAPLAPLSRSDLLALAVGLIPGISALLLTLRSYPLSWTGEWSGYHGDMPFFEALAAAVARLGPGQSIFMSGADLRYHSLAYGWAGQLTMAADAAPFVVLTRLLPLVGLIAAIALATAWTRQLTRTWWAPALAAGLVGVGGFVGAAYGGVLNTDSPSQTMGVIWLLVLSMLLMQALGRVGMAWHLLAVAVLVIALTGGKISTAAMAAAAFGVVTVVGLIRSESWRWRALSVAAVGLVALVATYGLLLAGSANSGGLRLFSLLDRASSVQGLNPVITPRGIVAGVLLLMVAVVPRWAGLAWLIGDRSTRWAPTTVYGAGLAAAGLGTIVVLSGGFNDLWFAVAASAPLAVLSAVGTAGAVDWLGPKARRQVLTAAIVGLAGALVVAGIWATGTTGILGQGLRWAGPVVGVLIAAIAAAVLARGVDRRGFPAVGALAIVGLVAMSLPARVVYAVAEPFARPQEGSTSPVLFTKGEDLLAMRDEGLETSWSDTQASAAAWLRANAGSEELVATNLTAGALVPSLTRLTTYISDIHMQAPYGRVGDFAEIQRREAQSWAFIDTPSAQTVDPLCQAGVDWIWVDVPRTANREWSPYADVAWSTDDVIILRLSRDACP